MKQVQTLLDVCAVSVGDENDVNTRNQVINNMSSVPLEHRVVTENETPLQIAARAPFSFWARARREVPFSFNGNPIREDFQYNQDFLKFVVRGDVSNLSEGELTRSGGCPVAHQDFKHLDLINAFGQKFSTLHRRMHITG